MKNAETKGWIQLVAQEDHVDSTVDEQLDARFKMQSLQGERPATAAVTREGQSSQTGSDRPVNQQHLLALGLLI